MGRKREPQPLEVRGTPAGMLGERLFTLVGDANLTPAEFAERIGVTEDAVRKYFRGVQSPVINRWPAIAKAVGLADAKDLLPKLPVD